MPPCPIHTASLVMNTYTHIYIYYFSWGQKGIDFKRKYQIKAQKVCVVLFHIGCA